MKVILNEDVHNLGEEGDIKDVAPGYARNYLIPKNLAVPHNRGNLATFEHRKAAIEKRKEEKRHAATSLKEQLEGLGEFVIEVSSGDTGKLFGSVTNANVADELSKLGYQIERKRIELPEHALKMVGKYKVKIKLYDSHVAELSLVISSPEMKRKEAEMAAASEAAPAENYHDDYDDEEPISENADLEAAAAELEAEEAAEESVVEEEAAASDDAEDDSADVE